MTNITCTCTDKWFIGTVEACVTASCNITDALSMTPRQGDGVGSMSDEADEPFAKSLVVARTNAEICHVPRRSRKGDLIAEITICVVAFFANIFRIYARWHPNKKFDMDDWIMVAVAVAVLFIPFQIIAQYFAFFSFGVDAGYVSPHDLTYSLEVRLLNSPRPTSCARGGSRVLNDRSSFST